MATTKNPKLPRKIKKAAFSDRWNYDLTKYRKAVYAQSIADRIESLKEKVQPQNTWKPSDDQMEALAWALSIAKNCGEECAFDLRTLQDQLKKLRDD